MDSPRPAVENCFANSNDISSRSDASDESSNLRTHSDTIAYFCVDLTDVSEDDILQLTGNDDGAEVELLHPYRTMKLCSSDRMLYNQAWPLIDWHHRYSRCPTCGSGTKLADGGYKRICQNTDCKSHKGVHNTSYPRVDPTVICAVSSPTSDRCVLANKVAFPSGMHSCVAGFVEPGETMEEACCREVQEEIGLDIDPSTLRYHSSQSWPGPSVLMIGYVAQSVSDAQEIVVDRTELVSARWFDRSEIVDMLVHEHPDALFIPPREAIAHQLVKSWVLETAFR